MAQETRDHEAIGEGASIMGPLVMGLLCYLGGYLVCYISLGKWDE